MFDLRKRILIISGIIVLVIILIFALKFFVFKNSSVETTEEQNFENLPASMQEEDKTLEINTEQVIMQEPANKDELYVKQISRQFVERFFTYSNQNENQHITDVFPIITSRMRDWVESKALEQSTEYSGVTSKVVSSKVSSFEETKAVVSVGIFQIVSFGNEIKKEDKNGRVELVQEDGIWKVDGFFWE
jgi:hypothetical protein